MVSEKYRAAIFDLDGTIADSLHVWDHICRDWLSEKGISTPPDSLEKDIAQMTTTQSAQYVIRNFGITLEPSAIQAQWSAMVLRQYAETIPLKEGAADLIKSLGAEGMKLAIATSCFPAACEAFLARHGLRAYFSLIIYTDEVTRDKRFPDIYLACADRLQIPPQSCVVFEDSPSALSGIRAAGMGLAAVYDAHSADQWEEFNKSADYAIRSFRDIHFCD